ncbi:hypothetical protein ABW20_dc0104524 [Dactylellina cionopaga]|nr:hypothetical protein ABW20_dc0104524 [Dactylellina cionopaga]
MGLSNNPFVIKDEGDDFSEFSLGYDQNLLQQFEQLYPQRYANQYPLHYEPPVKDDHEQVSKLLEHVKDDAENSPPSDRLQTPKELAVHLMEHQKIGLTWLVKQEESRNKGGILADDMGLGKTIQALALMVARKSDREQRKTNLIVCPVALMAQWQREIEGKVKKESHLSTYIYHGQQPKGYKNFQTLKKFDVVLTSYGTIAGEFKKKTQWREQRRTTFPPNEFPFLSDESVWYRVILDESQHVKNHRTLTSRACTELVATYRLCLSGTPMQNSIDDLFGAVRFLHLDRYNEFRTWNQDFGSQFKLRGQFAKSAMNRLQALLKAVMLRRKKDSLIDGKPLLVLPEKHIELIHPIFNEDELSLYQAVEQKVTLRFNKYLEENAVSRNYTYVLLLLLRLRQVCCHPKMIKDLSMKITEEEKAHQTDLMGELSPEVVQRLKEESVGSCPICFEADPLIKIILPCGHYLCQECLTMMGNQAQARAMEIGDEGHALRCPHCRGPLDPKRVIDWQVFQSVHKPGEDELMGEIETLENQLENALGGGMSSDSDDSDTESDDESSDEDSDLGGFIANDDEVESEVGDDDSEDDLAAFSGRNSRHSPVPPLRIKREEPWATNQRRVKKEDGDYHSLSTNGYYPNNSSTRGIKNEESDDDSLPEDIFTSFKREEGMKEVKKEGKREVNMETKKDIKKQVKKESKNENLRFIKDEAGTGKAKKKGKGKEAAPKKSRKTKKTKKAKGKEPKRGKTMSANRSEAMRNKKARNKYFRQLAREWTTSAKIEKVREILRTIRDNDSSEKTIIFSSFTSFLDLLQIPLQREDKISFERYDGSMSAKDRNDAVLNFTENPDVKVMLVSLKAGNSGLNLTVASHVIIIDPWWNPYVEEQAIDRAHRIGQTREVYVHRLIISNTVEDRILELQDRKREIISQAMDEEARKAISRLSHRDLVFLFTGNR